MADASLPRRPVVETILEGGGDYLGVVKDNQPLLKKAVDTWDEAQLSPQGRRWTANERRGDTGHGRVAYRTVWAVDSRAVTAYLRTACGWPRVQRSGWIQREHRFQGEAGQQSRETYTWASNLSPQAGAVQQVMGLLGGHWTIANSVFWVRDVGYGEDRLHGRQINYALSAIRNLAINLIRGAGYP